jgi:large subunit ribosomal protein L28
MTVSCCQPVVRSRTRSTVNRRGGWPERMRLLVRRAKPSRRHEKKLTDFDDSTLIFIFIRCSVKPNAGGRGGIPDCHARSGPAAACDSTPVPPRWRDPHPHGAAMSAHCQLTGRKPGFGNAVSHSHHRTRRRFDPDIQSKRYWLPSEGRFVRPTLSTKGIKTVDKIGIEQAVARVRAHGGRV